LPSSEGWFSFPADRALYDNPEKPMRSLLIILSLVAFAGTALAQTTASCPSGQTYDQSQKKCVSGSAKSGSGY
jgi:hypothetical protein